MREIKNGIVKGLHEHLQIPIVPTDTADRKPEYPYISYKVTTTHKVKSHSLVDDRDGKDTVTRKEQAEYTLSINAYSEDDIEAWRMAHRAQDWFIFHGYEYLKGLNIVVIETGDITDRTQQIVDDYERRYGFDVRIRVARGIVKEMVGIESWGLSGEVNPMEALYLLWVLQSASPYGWTGKSQPRLTTN